MAHVALRKVPSAPFLIKWTFWKYLKNQNAEGSFFRSAVLGEELFRDFFLHVAVKMEPEFLHQNRENSSSVCGMSTDISHRQ